MRTEATPWLRLQRIRGSINSRDQPQPCIMHKRSFAVTSVSSNASQHIRRGASSLAPWFGSVFVIQQQALGSRGGAREMHSAARSRTHAADAGMTHAGYYQFSGMGVKSKLLVALAASAGAGLPAAFGQGTLPFRLIIRLRRWRWLVVRRVRQRSRLRCMHACMIHA